MCRSWNRIWGSSFWTGPPGPLVVTPAGHLYADFCRDVLRRREEFSVALDQLKHEVEGTVRVASIYSVGLSEMVQLETGIRAKAAGG